jgi:hypothetical protein
MIVIISSSLISITVIIVSVIFVIPTIWILFWFFYALFFVGRCSGLFVLVWRRFCMLWILFDRASWTRFWLSSLLCFNLVLYWYGFDSWLDLFSGLTRSYMLIWRFRFSIIFYNLSWLLLSSMWYSYYLLFLFHLWLYLILGFYSLDFLLSFRLWFSLLFLLLNRELFFDW